MVNNELYDSAPIIPYMANDSAPFIPYMVNNQLYDSSPYFSIKVSVCCIVSAASFITVASAHSYTITVIGMSFWEFQCHYS